LIEWQYHERKSDAGRLDALDGPHDCRAGDLYQSEVVDTRRAHVTQVDVIRLVLDRHQQQQHSVDELSTISHVRTRYDPIRPLCPRRILSGLGLAVRVRVSS